MVKCLHEFSVSCNRNKEKVLLEESVMEVDARY